MTVSVIIKNKKAKKLLEDLASLDIIQIKKENKESSFIKNPVKKEKTLTHLASEKSLAKTWDTAGEDEAWQNL